MKPAPPLLPTDDTLWEPNEELRRTSNLTRFLQWIERKRNLTFPDYAELWEWSTSDLEGFWTSIAEYFEVRFQTPPTRVLSSHEMPGAEWFRGATLNYAEHVLRETDANDDVIVYFESETAKGELTRSMLKHQVAVLANELRQMGVAPGDCIAGFLPNLPETVIAFLAAASIGAIWTNCSVELNSRAVLDRLTQINPKVLLAVTQYQYGGKGYDRRDTVEEIVEGLPKLQKLILVNSGAEVIRAREGQMRWEDLPQDTLELVCEPVPFNHPLFILYSSGTTGLPKAIVHGHGGILLEHLKALSLHLDLRAGDRFFWFTTSGWMMWNFLVSGLLLPGVSIVLYDGSPKFPDFDVLWSLVQRLGVTYFGASAPYLTACQKAKVKPGVSFTLESLRSIGSTGAPLHSDGFHWVYDNVKRDLLLGSVSGGTDVCTAFVLSNPLLPVRAGKIQCIGLGAKIEAWNEEGHSVFGQVGELVLTAPFPSMPVFFWNDADGSRYRASYFEKFPGIWSHGDWIEIESSGGACVIHGRSDATLNRGGLRMGTAEFYSIVEKFPEIEEALVVNVGGADQDDRLLLFVVLHSGHTLDDTLIARIRSRLRTELSPRHLPDAVYSVPEIPHTMNGKKLEVPVKRILSGIPLDKAVNVATVANPEALRFFHSNL